MRIFRKILAVMLVAGVMVCSNGIVNAKAEENLYKDDEISRVLSPFYDIRKDKAFFVGNTRIDMCIYIRDNKGGVEYSASDYCDFYIEDGYVENSWSEHYYFSGSRNETMSTEFSAFDYVAGQPIHTVYVNHASICADGDSFNERIYSAELDYVMGLKFNWENY